MSAKNVLVTGASSGLGDQFCRTLAANGYTVIAAARRKDRLESLCNDISEAGGVAHPLAMDVSDVENFAIALDEAEAMAGPITCLINNAGTSVSKFATDMTPEDFDAVMGLNLRGPYFLSTELARRWIARNTGGRIVNIGSLSDSRAMPGHTVYGTSKAAIARLTQQMAREWINKGINVNALAPGYIRTELNAPYFDSPNGQAVIAQFPRRRVGEPADLDKAILYLCDPDQRFLTGQVLHLDDGQGL
ncbi:MULTISPECIES: SDR family NAD(P)-dependent oxidoreductase [Roseobacteraceae]|uniref:Glucose 1-dehydrogenase n=1 Tax=Falsiruegeria mediterranea M17 TaxID=1200281 RepID=A0A2R8CG28_9RHOB|nr:MULTISPECIES: SDR family NAD(P)-dependent oxidoreductase [Roseobacteraceae]SPJ31380.1 Glucose 1-dehydrogenase [Falsiruegeria mediterranea M17]